MFVRVQSFIHNQSHATSPANAELQIRGMGEFALIAFGLLVAEWAIPGPASLTSLSPQPFWLPVLLLAAQYGTASGLAAAVLALLLSLITGWPDYAAHEDLYSYLLRILREPILWFVAAMAIGEIRNRHMRRQQTLQLLIQEADMQRAKIADHNCQLQYHTNDLERRLATIRDNSIGAGLERLARLENAGECELPQALHEALRSLTGATRYSVYLNRGGTLVRDAALSSPATVNSSLDQSNADRRHADHTLPSRVSRELMQRRARLSVLRAPDAELLDGIGAFACPVTCVDGFMHGTIVLEVVDSNALQPATQIGLTAVSDCLAVALAAGTHIPHENVEQSNAA